MNTTMSFIDKQQQLINENLNTTNNNSNSSTLFDSNATASTAATTKSPSKKLTKKQLLLQQSPGADDSLASAKKTPAQRKIKPKKGSLDTSMTSGVDESGAETDKCTLSATAQSKIDATIDDFMKQYKIKTKSKKSKSKKSATEQTPNGEEDANEDGDDEDEDCSSNDDDDDDESNRSDDDDESDDGDDESDADEQEGDDEEKRMRKLDAKDPTFDVNNSRFALILVSLKFTVLQRYAQRFIYPIFSEVPPAFEKSLRKVVKLFLNALDPYIFL